MENGNQDNGHQITVTTRELQLIHDALYYYVSHDLEHTDLTNEADALAKQIRTLIWEWELEA